MAKPGRVSGQAAQTEPPETRHRITIRVLVILATLLAFLAIFTSWIDRQALDTNHWVNTSGRLLEDKEISDALATSPSISSTRNVDVAANLKKRLPPDLQPVASPAAAGIREFATKAAQQAFQSPRVQQLWQDANRVAHTELVSILEDKHAAVSSQNGKVVLDLRPIVFQLADRIGLKKQAKQAIHTGEEKGVLKPNFAQLQVADSQQLDTARTVVKLIQGLAWFFMIGTIALFVVAAYLARGRRWVVVLGYGLGLIASGLAAMAIRAALKGVFVDSLAKTEAANVPAQHAWDIGTSLSCRAARQAAWSSSVCSSWLPPSSPPLPTRRSASARLWPRTSAIVRGRLVDLRGGRADRGDHLASRRHSPGGAHALSDRLGGRRPRGAQEKDRSGVPGRQARATGCSQCAGERTA